MNQEPTNWDEEWEGLEPEQSAALRNWMLLGMVGTVLLLVLLCLWGLYGGIQQLGARTGEEQLLPPVVGNGEENGEETADPPPEDGPVLAPTVTLPGAPNSDQSGSGQAVAVPVTTSPTTNADLSDWPDGPTAESRQLVYRADGITGPPSAQADWRLAWDGEYLYVAATVTDDIHVQTQRDNLIFRGDSLELQIETNPGRNGRTLGPSNFQIALSPGNFGDILPSAFRFQGTTEGAMRNAAGGHNILVAARQTGTGYILEAAIPWSNLNLTPTPGMQLGLALNVNDNDSPGTAQQQMMISNVSTRLYADPTSWGRLTLQE